MVGWREYLEIKRKRQRPWGLWRFILEELAVSNRRCVFRLPSGQPPICTGDQPFSLAFRLTSDLRRRSISGSAFQLNLRFSSTVRSFDLPSGQPPTCVGDQPSGLPSSQPSTCVSGQPSGPTFASTCDLRRLPILRPGLPTDLQLAPSINLPAHPPADFQLAPSFNLPGSAFEPNFRLSSAAQSLRRCLPVNLRLAPPINLPALPDGPTYRHRLSHLRLCFPVNLRLASSTGLSAWPSNSTSVSSAAASRRRCRPANLRLSPPIHRPTLPDGPTTDSSALHLWRRFRPILDSRLRSTFGCLQVNLQLALATNPPAEPSCQSPACAFDQPSGCLPI